jgi:hypothetical protein
MVEPPERNQRRDMNVLSQIPAQLQRVFEPTRGVVGLVDELLSLCPEQGLQFEWRANQCRVGSLDSQPDELIDVSLTRSAFRAMLARIAALCNETVPNSVSPYGGKGEISACTETPTMLGVALINTPDEQRLELRPLAGDNGDPTDHIALLNRHQ